MLGPIVGKAPCNLNVAYCHEPILRDIPRRILLGKNVLETVGMKRSAELARLCNGSRVCLGLP